MKIDFLSTPAMITWQMTRDCDLACLHCCTDSAPGKALPGELNKKEALTLADQIVEAQVPYVMLVGGEPTIYPHFWDVVERLSAGGVFLKIESNGNSFGEAEATRFTKSLVRSFQLSIDGATQAVYQRTRVGGDLEKVKLAARAIVKAGLPLEITFAPSKLNIHEAEEVIDLALELGAFRFNTGRLMRLGTAAKLWDRLCPDGKDYENFYNLLVRKEAELAGRMELCFRPFSLKEELESRTTEPSGTLLVLPDGKVKVAAPLPYLCADLKKQTLRQAWTAYREAWTHPRVVEGLKAAAEHEERLAEANRWVMLETDLPVVV